MILVQRRSARLSRLLMRWSQAFADASYGIVPSLVPSIPPAVFLFTWAAG